jgi:hypothetical protein
MAGADIVGTYHGIVRFPGYFKKTEVFRFFYRPAVCNCLLECGIYPAFYQHDIQTFAAIRDNTLQNAFGMQRKGFLVLQKRCVILPAKVVCGRGGE